MAELSDATKASVRQRANGCCEYCHKPDGFHAHKHQVDHIISRKHSGSDELENLAYACFQCNVNKGSDVAGYDPVSGGLVPLFNPRTQSWDDHFEMNEAVIAAKTGSGRLTLALLQINHPDQIETRTILMEAGLW